VINLEDKLLKRAESLGADYADLRVVESSGMSMEIKDGELKKTVTGDEKGLSIRILYKGAWGFSATSDLSKSQLNLALQTAFDLASANSTKIKEPVQLKPTKILKNIIDWKPKKNPADVDIKDKFELISDMDNRIHEFENILTVTTGYSDSQTIIHFLSTEGSDITSKITRTVAQANLIARKEANIIGFRTRVGGTKGYEIFKDQDPIVKGEYAAEAVNRILVAKPAPSGVLTLVADPSLAGVFAHEALGHAAEADQVVSHESILEGMIGELIAGENVTIIDDSTIPGGFGSFPVDDEGVLGSKKIIIQNGVLKNFIYNRETAFKLDAEPNGGARADSFSSRPLVRMSNTMIEPGEHTFEELIGDIDRGIYAKGTRGGEVDTAKGTFQFNAQEAFLIENGELTTPLRDVSLSGLTLEILKHIDAMTKVREFGEPGFCGKGQFVPVGDGGPYIRVQNVTVGGME
jgi:TldD protein